MRALLGLGIAAGVLLLAAAAALAWAGLRPNRAEVDPALVAETWSVVSDGEHNSNVDLAFWRDRFVLVHAASPYHMGTPESRLVVRHSQDGRRFETVATLRVPESDIRDPKLAAIGDRLFLYALPNDSFYATPEGTVLSTSEDGVAWTPFEPVGPPGWLFWRPKTRDGRTWYVPAYWHEHGEAILLRSTDGRRWRQVSVIHSGEGNDETAIEFLPDGRMLATARLEITPDALFGNPEGGTLLAVAEPPYTRWAKTRSDTTRLDGPALFPHAGGVYAVARFQPGGKGFPTRPGSVFARKRTALFRVEPERLTWLSDLPSAGDTAYAGVVRRSGRLFACYYTSPIDRDYPWLLGMLLPTELRMAEVPLDALAPRPDGPSVARR